jgi:hypothetical protein
VSKDIARFFSGGPLRLGETLKQSGARTISWRLEKIAIATTTDAE